MRHPIKYFIFNKDSDFARGSRYHAELQSPGIGLTEAGTGYFYSRLLDSREKNMQWHRILVEGDTVSEASVRFWIYASDSRTFLWEGKTRDIGEVIEDDSISEEEKYRMLEPCLKKVMDNPKDMLLHEVEGEYLWFRIRLISQGEAYPKITRIKIIFPKNTWLSYLPEVYQEDETGASFVERYLGMFQSMYQDMSDKIYRIPEYMDPDAAHGPFLQWLGTWLSIEDSYIWKEDQLRYLIAHGVELYRKRGTVDYLKEMVQLYTGKPPYIVEYHQLEPYMGDHDYAERLMELYGKNSYIFTVIVDMDSHNSNREYKILTRIIEQAKPAHIESNIIVLEPFIFLDKHSYLGINSVLGSYGAFVLDGQASIPFTALTAREDERGN